jgi:hypothetical protein
MQEVAGMKAYLMFRDKDFDIKEQLPFGKDMLVSDLELETLLSARAQGDEVILEAAGTALLCGLQSALSDCIKNPAEVRDLYAITIEAIERVRKGFWWLSTQYTSNAVGLLQALVGMLVKLRKVADESIDRFESEGFVTLHSLTLVIKCILWYRLHQWVLSLSFPNSNIIRLVRDGARVSCCKTANSSYQGEMPCVGAILIGDKSA